MAETTVHREWKRFFRYVLVDGKIMLGWRKAGDNEPDYAGKYLVAKYSFVAGTAYAIDQLWQFNTAEQASAKLDALLTA